MHILILPSWYPVAPSEVSGSFFREQARALHRAGCEVGVVVAQLQSIRDPGVALRAPRGVTVEDDEGVRTVRSHGVNWTPRIRWLIRRAWLRHGELALAEYLSRFGQPDVVHAHAMLDAGILARRIFGRFGIPYVVTEHSSIYARGLFTGSELRSARTVAARAKRRLAVSANLASLLGRLLGGSAGAWTVLPNIVCQAFLDRPIAENGDSAFTFISVALMDEKKDHSGILHAFARAFPSPSSVGLVLAGDGVLRKRLEAEAKALGIAPRVRFTGMLSRTAVLDEMSAADALVLGSLHETFGVAVVEALALGKPVIATRCGGPEMIVRPEDGLLVPVGDPGALAEAMQRIVRDRSRYSAAAIREACSARFSEQQVSSALIDLYASVVADEAR